MVRVINGRQFYWLMSYLEKSEALERAERYRSMSRVALARVIRSKKGFYEVWATQASSGKAA